jgi:predicted outer membrane repeat protein
MNRRNQRMLSIALVCVLIITLGVAAPVSAAYPEDTRIIYVRANAEDDGDGTTWDTAYNDLQDALAKAKSIAKGSKVHIWVAEGMYKPGGKRNASFRMLNNVSIFGGFPEDGGDWEERDWEEHETILSGDIGKSGKDDDNCYHVLYNAKVDNTAILDGFTITGGYAKPTFIGLQVTGGGVYNESASPTFCNVNINGNFALAFGGGMYNDRSDPVLTNVTITDNRSLGSGGGIFNKKSDPALNGVAISENDSLLRGGGMHNSNSDPVLTNVTFHDNNCSGLGGGLYNEDSNLVITDSEFSENSSRNGGGIYSQGSEVTLTGVKFISNEADSISGWEFVGNGGAVYCFGGTLSCTETEFHFNSANSDGGAIHNLGGDLDLKDVSFANNTAGVFPREVVAAMARWKYPQANGGAICSLGSCKIDGAEFDHNQAKDNGGAIYFGLSGGLNALELSNAIFTGNSAEQDGGAVHATLASLVDSVFSGNSAHRGGGLALTQWGGIVNSTFAANTATQCGGGLYTSFIAYPR